MSTRLGLQIPNFSYGTGIPALFPAVIAQAREAESAGFDTVFLMDHLYQLPGAGAPDQPMLEAYTALGALATATDRIQLGALVTGNTYRNPALLAKIVTTLDVVSSGRAVLGLGAGWFELEHQQLGFEYGTFTDRFQRLDEALQIIEPMLRGERPTFNGTWYHTETAINEPRYRDRIPVLLGGGGERKTFALAARYADHLNLIAGLSELPVKLDALARRCDEVGRDRATLETSVYLTVVIDENGDKARGLFTERQRAAMADRAIIGSPDDVAEQIQSRVLDLGIDGVTVNLAAHGYTPGVIELTGKALLPLVSS